MPLNLPDQPDWVPVPPEEEPEIGAADNRYHIIFSDAPDQATEVERLGLMLTESGPIGFNVQMSSPFAGQLSGPGNREDKDLSRWTVRSQRDWRGGRGQLTTYADTDRFHDSLADTRFPNQVLLPPAKTKAALAAVSGPEFSPTASSATSQMRVGAAWTNSGRVAQNQTAHATYELLQGSDPEYAPAPIGVEDSFLSSASGTPFKFIAQSFTPAASVTLSTVRLMLSTVGANSVSTTTIAVLSDNGASPNSGPGATTHWTHTLSAGEAAAVTATPTWYTFSSTPVALTSGVKYWILVTHSPSGWVNVSVGPSGYSGGEMYIQERYAGVATVISTWPTDREIIFKINNGAAGVDGALTRVRLAQSFVAAQTKTTASVRVNIAAIRWVAGSVCSVNIYSDSGSSPNAIIGATGTATMPTDTNEAWVTVTMACALTSGTTYWLVITPNSSTFSNNISLTWTGSTSAVGTSKSSTETGGSWGAWSAFTQVRFHFGVTWSIVDDLAGYDTRDLVVTSRAQSFTTDASTAVTPTKIRLYLQLISWVGSPTLTLGIFADSGNLPTGGAIYSATLTQSTFTGQQAVQSANWVELSPGSPGALSLATKYWLVLTPTAAAVGDQVYVDWQTDTLGNFSGGESALKTVTNGSGAWAAGTTGTDGYFIVNDGRGSSSASTVRPVRFGSGWYIAAGLGVYKYNTSTNVFDLKYTAAATVTSLCAFGGSLYAALGDSNDMVASADGASWSPVTGRQYTHLLAYNGYLYAAKSVGGSTSLAYFANATWSPNITLANSSVTISDLIGFGNELLITATTGLWALSSNLVYQVLDFSNENYGGNGVNSLTWMADGRMYIPIGQSLHAYDGTRLVPVGLDLEEGLPLDQQGHISCLVGTRTFLFASVDGGTTSRSGIYAFNGKGWHCLAQASTPGRRIRSMGLEQITSSTSRPRLWYFEDGSPYYLEFPDLTDNPAGYLDSAGVGIAYQPVGYVTSAWIGGELSAVSKDFQSIVVASTGCTTGKTIDLFIEVDRSGIWLPVGTVYRSPLQEYSILSRTWGPLTVSTTKKAGSSTASIIVVAEDTATVLQAGDFVRIGDEVRQVSTLESADSFGLLNPLTATPADGTIVYPARPSGREIRYKAVLNSNVPDVTPVLQRVSVRMQERLIDKFRFTLSVRLEDSMRLHGSSAAADLYTASELRSKLYQWVRRLSPFYMTDPAGTVYRVKVANASESGWTRTNQDGVSSWKSVMAVTLDEI